MANFFKDYHAELNAKRKAEENAKVNHTEYKQGQIVHINPMYDEERNGKRYFSSYLNNGYVLLAKTKKDALNGYGHIYNKCAIIKS